MVETLYFPQLGQLGLLVLGVRISDGALLHNIITGCPHLEYLLLNGCSGFQLSIAHGSTLLGALEVFVKTLGEWELLIEDAPSSLESLLQLGRPGCLDVSEHKRQVQSLAQKVPTRDNSGRDGGIRPPPIAMRPYPGPDSTAIGGGHRHQHPLWREEGGGSGDCQRVDPATAPTQ
ncbi:hypothetical protein C2845_PM10G06530 [Panicum miliaceum]|uniref:F-box/LRR-repeat protein 15/At3g58940/PEG3-like LRR domain-containing protein n=1 Tax=Panicum miliaceum TaxID=4540 RepID=A0A3L6PGD1_PANMI|nr:hypothetical protein C2845_PM10G06530 [Panicum miliaceum]